MNHCRTTLACMLAACALAAGATSARADAPGYIPLQGYLTDDSGTVLDGAQTIAFAIYPSEDVAAKCLHEEVQSVNVDQGYFTAYLGDGTPTANCDNDVSPIDLSIFRDHAIVFLGVRVGSDPEASPRIQLATAPFAGLAQYAVDASKLGGVDASSYARSSDLTWSKLSGIPADLADGDDNHTETEIKNWAKEACFDTEAELTTLLNDNYAAINHNHNSSYISSVTANNGLTGGGGPGSITVSHADTSSQSSADNSGNTYIQDVSLDTYGHVTGLTSAPVTGLAALTGCATGDVPVWNGSAWACGEQKARAFVTPPTLVEYVHVDASAPIQGTSYFGVRIEDPTVTRTADPPCNSANSGLIRVDAQAAEHYTCFCNKLNYSGNFLWWCIEIEP